MMTAINEASDEQRGRVARPDALGGAWSWVIYPFVEETQRTTDQYQRVRVSITLT